MLRRDYAVLNEIKAPAIAGVLGFRENQTFVKLPKDSTINHHHEQKGSHLQCLGIGQTSCILISRLLGVDVKARITGSC